MLFPESNLGIIILVVLFFYETRQIVGQECGYKNRHKYDDMVTFSNGALRKFVRLESLSRLKETFSHFNVERKVGSQQHKNVRKYIESTLDTLGWTVREDNFTEMTPIGMKTFTNIMASSNPDAPYRLVLACHYDSKNMSAENIIFIGATDSAIPCTIMLDVAKTLSSQLRQNQNLSLELVFFDGEEAFIQWSDTDSIYGAKHLAQLWNSEPASKLTTLFGGRCTQLDTINALILLDLIGAKGLKLHNLYSGNTYSTTLFDQFKNIEARLRKMKEIKTSVTPIFVNELLYKGATVEDDHLPFKRAGVNVVHLISLPFPKVWHKETDNAQALDWNTIENMNTIVRVFIASYFNIALP